MFVVRVRHGLGLLVVLLGLCASTGWAQGRIEGLVIEQHTGLPLAGVNVRLLSTQRGAASDAQGRFVIADLPADTYTVQLMMIGFEQQRVQGIAVRAGETTSIEVALAETVTSLREVVVTPGRFAVMQAQPVVTQTFTRDDIQALPQIGEDIYRAVRRLPGLAGNDFSSQLNVRGGLHDEVLVELDGMTLYEPFHVKDVGDGAISVLDVEAIGGIDMMTGAFPVEYGDRLSGVFSLASATPVAGRSRTSLGLSFMNARFLSEGRFDGGDGEWLLLARRGYLDIVLKITDDEDDFSPTYYDVFGKVKKRLNDRHSLAFYALHSGDRLKFDDVDDAFTAQTGYGSTYGWATWDAVWTPRLHARTVASVGHLGTEREGNDVVQRDGAIYYAVDHDQGFLFGGLKQDWTFELADRHLLKGGFDVKHLGASYDYFKRVRTGEQLVDDHLVLFFDSTRIDLDPVGTQFGGYLGHRLRVTRPLTMEWGVRYDYMSWSDDHLVSPRINLAVALGRRTSLRAGWGWFYQAQGLHQLAVRDGEDQFHAAERAEHRMIGITHALTTSVHVRVEAYQKKLSDLHPRYVNLEDASADFFPEAFQNRIRLAPERGEARGVEVFMRRDNGRHFNWLASYSYAVAEDHVAGRDVPRRMDQRHTVFLDVNYQPNPKWRFTMGWQYHSGWPYTELTFTPVTRDDGSVAVEGRYGPYLAERFPAYHRLDVRIRRYFPFTRSRLSVFAEVSNLYDRSNVREYDYNVSVRTNGTLDVQRETSDWLPLFPSIGVSWDLFR